MNVSVRLFLPTLVILLSMPVLAGARGPPQSQQRNKTKQLAIVAARFLVECPVGTKRTARSLRRNFLQARVAIEQPKWEVRCMSAGNVANGPAALVRHSYRTNRMALANKPFFLAHQLVWAGSYHDGKRHGQWRQFNRKGEELGRNTFAHGTGAWRAWRSAGELAAEGSFEGDLESGAWRYWFADGQVATAGAFVAGKRDGRWQRMYPDGRLRSDVSYRGGHSHGLSTEWHRTGEKRFEGAFEKGLRDGEWAFWNTRGELLGVNLLQKGSGRWMEWSDSGKLRASGWKKSGKRHGHWRFYGRDGELSQEGDYHNGSRMRGTWKRYTSKSVAARRRGAPRALALLQRSATSGMFHGIRGAGLGRGLTVGGLGVRGTGAKAGPGGAVARIRGLGGVRLKPVFRGSGTARASSRRAKMPSTMPEVRLTVRSAGGAKPHRQQLRRAEATVRMCTIGFDIKRLRRAAQQGVAAPPAAINDSATLLVTIDARGRADTVRIARSASTLDATWHRCVTTAVRLLRFKVSRGWTGASAEIDIRVR